MKYSDRQSDYYSKSKQADMEIETIKQAGIHPAQYIATKMLDGDGFELPQIIRNTILATAQRRIKLGKVFVPPRVPPDRAIPIGVHPQHGYPVELDIQEVVNVLILGATKTGKNITGRNVAKGILCCHRKYRVVAYKGDELNDVKLSPNSIFLSIQRDPCNELVPPHGVNRTAFWTAQAEAYAIPKWIAPQTQPVIPELLDRMWRSAPNPSFIDLSRAFKWLSEQPGGREKHITAGASFETFSYWLGEKAYVRTGVDIRSRYDLIVYGYYGASKDDMEASLGMKLVLESFEALGRGHSRDPRVFIFFPEGQILFDESLEYARRGHVGYLSRAAMTVNSLGIGLIVAAQSPSKLSRYLLANCPTIIALRQESPDEAFVCAKLLGQDERIVPQLMSLPQGQAIVRMSGWDEPVLVAIPYVDLGASQTLTEIENQFSSDYERLRNLCTYADRIEVGNPVDWMSFGSKTTSPPNAEQAPKQKSNTEPQLFDEHYAFLKDVKQHDGDGLKIRYDRLGWGVERGNRILRELKSAEYIRVDLVPNQNRSGGRGRLVPYITKAGEKWLEAYETRS